MKDKALILFSFLVFTLICVSKVQAQQTININNENNQISSLQLKSNDPIVMSVFKDAQTFRQFDPNPQLLKLSGYNIGDILLLDLFEDSKYEAVIKNVSTDKNGITGITAQIKNIDFGYCYIAVSPKSISMSIDFPLLDEHYFAGELNGKIYLSKYKKTVKQKEIAPEYNPLVPDIPETQIDMLNAPIANDGTSCNVGIEDKVIIDVLVVYTAAAAEWVKNNSGYSDINSLINIDMQMSNTVMDNSQTGIRFRMVHSYQTNYTEDNSSKDLDRITYANDGYMDEVHGLRDQYKADMVVFLPKVEFTGGLAWLLNNENGDNSSAFALSRVQQAGWTYTTVHEMGHNMGCHHHKDQKTQAGPGLYNYSAGWRGKATWGANICSIMTYEEGSSFDDGISHQRIPYFSSPDLNYGGTIIGDAYNANNTLTIKKVKYVTSMYCAKPRIDIKIKNLSKMNGLSDLAFEYTVNCGSLENNDKIVLSRKEGEEIGNYPIIANIYRGGVIVDNEYDLFFNEAFMSIYRGCFNEYVDEATVCLNTPFTWEGINFDVAKAGVKTEVKELIDIYGCDSIVTFTLTVLPEPTLTIIPSWGHENVFCLNADKIYLAYNALSDIEKLTVEFDDNAKQYGFIDFTYTHNHENTITIPVPQNLKAGEYKLTITAKSNNGCYAQPLNITLKAFTPADNIIIQKWKDVLACNNAEDNFVNYQWYKNGLKISDGQKQFIYIEMDYNALYNVVISTKSGGKIETCPISLKSSEQNEDVTSVLFPNPVNASESVNLRTGLSNNELKNATVTIYNTNGQKQRTLNVTNETISINMPDTPGMYLVILNSMYGQKTFRVLVK